MKAVIIDDEQPARDLIKIFLEEYDDIEVIGEAANGFEGAKLINKINPDLLFLDIQMPKIDGFEMLELLDNVPQVIFCTAYDQYAIKAFDKKAIDYLLKPFSRTRFGEAIEKVNQKKLIEVAPEEYPQSVDYQKPLDRIVIKDRKEIIIVNVEDIDFFEAQDDYVEIYSSKGHWLKQQTMKYFEKGLDGQKFCRVHRKYIIQISRLAKLDKLGKESFIAVLKNGSEIPISMSGYSKLKELLGI